MSAPVAEKDIKEVAMDVAAAPQEGGGTRKRRGRRRRTQKGGAEEEVGPAVEASVEKVGGTPNTAAPVAPNTNAPAAPVQTGGAAKKKAPTVIIAPAKKKPAKLLLVPKAGAATAAAPAKHRVVPKKTFKAKRVRVVIDNTAKTVKRRRQILGQVDAMTEDQLRAAAVQARLARRDSVASVPMDLLRQMVRDYQTMRGALL